MAQVTFGEVTDRLLFLYRENKFGEALDMIEAHLDAFPEQKARMVFWRMCLLSLSDRPADVMSVFEQGLDAGLWWQDELFTDSDLDTVRDLPEFRRLMAISQDKYEEARSQVERDCSLLLPEPPASGPYPLLITLHGRNGNKDTDLGQWNVARQRGWLVLACQSTQPVFQGAYHWDNPAIALTDLLFYYEQVSQNHPVDLARIVLGGFSQGSGMAIYEALRGNIPARGFIGIGTWWADASELAVNRQGVRGYFVTGEKDQTLDRAREIQDVLRGNNIPFDEEVHADLGHEFPADFGFSFDKAIAFIFKEQE